MQTLQFSIEEIEVLRDVLQQCSSEMEVEVLRTDMHDYKQMLKHRREVLERLLAKVSAVPLSV